MRRRRLVRNAINNLLKERGGWMDRQEDKEDQWRQVTNEERKERLVLKLAWSNLIQEVEEKEKRTKKAEDDAGKLRKFWAEKEVQLRTVAAERKKWQAKRKALPVETVSIASQTDHAAENVEVETAEIPIQTEEEIELLKRMMEKKRGGKRQRR
ncbi:hypothetical protein BGX38DRAFT_1334226 [Terfezia claveryi]|nr:hypothetical protein BGX38DRAFT_1334226 [Terfezia claveryi]